MSKSSSVASRYEDKFLEGFLGLHKNPPAATFLAEGSSKPEARKLLNFAAFRKDVFLYTLMVDHFAQAGIDLHAARALDVGGGEGTMARLMKSEKLADWVQVVELYEMNQLLPDDLYRRHLRKLRLLGLLHRLGIRHDLYNHATFAGYDYFPSKSSKFFNVKDTGDGKIDEYQLRNFYELDGKYDLITAFSIIDYFNPELFFEKASSLLNPGGFFYAHLAYWWFPVNCALVVGDFPYAGQRLTRSELSEYLEERHPALKQDILTRYDYFHLNKDHPTIADYVELGERFDLEPVFVRPMMPKGGNASKMTPLHPTVLGECKDFSFAEVLEDIARHRPGVRLLDLLTFNVLIGFRKRGPKTTTLQQRVNAIRGLGASDQAVS